MKSKEMITAYITINPLNKGIEVCRGYLSQDGRRFYTRSGYSRMDEADKCYVGSQFHLTMENAIKYAKEKIEKRKAVILKELQHLEWLESENDWE